MFLYLRLSEAFNAAGGTRSSAFLLETQHMAERWSSGPSSINYQSLGNSLVWQTISLRGLQADDFWGCHKLRDNPILFWASGDSYQESELLHTVNTLSSSVSNTLNASHRNIFQATDRSSKEDPSSLWDMWDMFQPLIIILVSMFISGIVAKYIISRVLNTAA